MAVGDDAVPARNVTASRWWERRWLLVAIVLATMVPLVYPPIPPLADLLGHMGRYRIELDIGHSQWLQRYYDFHWMMIGNLGVDLLIIPLSKIIGLEPAVKLIVLLIPPLTAAGFLWVAREVHGRVPPTAFFALPFIYSFPFLYGFVNYALSMALAFIAFALWLWLGRTKRWKLRGWLFVPISLIVFFCQVYGWGLLGLMCFSAELVRLRDGRRPRLGAVLGAALSASVLAVPLLVMLVWRNQTHAGSTDHWFDLPAKVQWIVSALRDRWKWFDVASVVLALVVIVEARRRDGASFSRRLVWPALVLTVIFFSMPLVITGSAYADMRFVPYIFAIALLAIRLRDGVPAAGMVAAIGVAFFAVRIASNTISLAIASNQQQAQLAALDLIPRGARVATLVGEPCGPPWPVQRRTHLGAMVIVRREGFSNDQWLLQGINLLGLRYSAARLFAADPSELVHPIGCTHTTAAWSIDEALTALPRDAFDYLWLIDPPQFNPELVAGLQPVWRGPDAILYRIPTSRPSR